MTEPFREKAGAFVGSAMLEQLEQLFVAWFSTFAALAGAADDPEAALRRAAEAFEDGWVHVRLTSARVNANAARPVATADEPLALRLVTGLVACKPCTGLWLVRDLLLAACAKDEPEAETPTWPLPIPVLFVLGPSGAGAAWQDAWRQLLELADPLVDPSSPLAECRAASEAGAALNGDLRQALAMVVKDDQRERILLLLDGLLAALRAGAGLADAAPGDEWSLAHGRDAAVKLGASYANSDDACSRPAPIGKHADDRSVERLVPLLEPLWRDASLPPVRLLALRDILFELWRRRVACPAAPASCGFGR